VPGFAARLVHDTMDRTLARNVIVALLFALLLAASGSAQEQTDGGRTSGVYRIDAARSDIRLLVYRAGVLARFGHNHVISVGEFEGTITLHSDPERSSVELEIPVHGLIVDDPELRIEEGDEFSTDLSEADINRTRGNMLGGRVLNAEQYPIVRIMGRGFAVERQEVKLSLSVELLGRVIELSAPVALRLDGDELEASGALRVSHAMLGMTPFKAAFWALRVADEMDLKFRIRARRVRD